MEYVADRLHNPFDMDPPCERFVPGYGATTAHFHVVGDHPSVHGGLSTGVPFTDRPWSERFFDALRRGGLVETVDLAAGDLGVARTFLSYLHMCAPDAGRECPTEDDYRALEPFFDAELRAVTAHVLLPVGRRATEHVLAKYTSRRTDGPVDLDALHATELRGAGFLVVPVCDPAEWTDDDAAALVGALRDLLASDYRQLSDLGRFLPDDRTHVVR